ncbi:hypothetical protein PsorP6_018689 [Peronosclerospora sorghi]|nr:hypothetical protein PsorP6_018689 [Peronosclerospora sorghi]
MDESPPTILMECATKYLDIMGRLTSKSYLRMARRAELQCLEIFFRFDLCNFSVFEDACVTGLTDCGVSVRFTASRSLQSLYFMYPEGGGRIFRHIYKTLERLVAASIESSDHDTEGQTRGHECYPRMTMDSCLSVILCLYVSACSSQIALPIVLQACVAIVSRNQSFYVSGTTSLQSTWLNPIALFYGYADVCSMVDDHFCNIWHAFLAEGRQLADSEEEHDVEWMKSDRVATLSRQDDWLHQFPLYVLCGNFVLMYLP